MDINLPVFEILVILFFAVGFKWLFRFLVLALGAKIISGVKAKAEASVKEHLNTLKEGREEK